MTTWMLTRLSSGPWLLFRVGSYEETQREFATLQLACAWLAEHGEAGR